MNSHNELRKLPEASLYKVADILDINNDWQKLMSFIPKNLHSEHFEARYNSKHMRLIEEHSKKSNRKCAEILFHEWGTSGPVRPTLDTLMHLLLKAEIYRAADEVAHIMLKEPNPDRHEDGPAAESDLPDFSALLPKSLNNMNSFTAEKLSTYSTDIPPPSSSSQYVLNMDILHEIDNAILQDKNLVHFGYTELETIIMITFSTSWCEWNVICGQK